MDKYNQSWVTLLADHNAQRWAITIGQTTYYSCTESEVSLVWHCHEDTHKAQWKRDGWIKFIVQYLWWQIRYGYENNPYEIEARNTAQAVALRAELQALLQE